MAKKISISSFVVENSGVIAKCNANILCAKKQKMSFCDLNKGKIEESYDTKDITHNVEPYAIEQDIIYTQLSTKEQLIDIMQKINEGNKEYINGKYILCNDIDLKGVKFTPIGNKEECAFRGIFNGNGYKIYNIVIERQKSEYVGFFGYLKKAKIVNLAIDVTIKGGKNIGGLAGLCQGTVICSCTTNVHITGGLEMAGFVARNIGEITNCYATGSIKNKKLAPILCGSTALLASACLAIVLLYKQGNAGNEYFPPIPIDEFATKYDNAEPAVGNNKIDCGFTSTVMVNNKEKVARLNFKNPGKSNQHMVIQIQLTDEELINKTGENGRTAEQQKQLDESGTYNPKQMRIVVGESGTVPPGYKLEEVQMKDLPNGKQLKAGEYNAIVYLTFYDIGTNHKSMINTQTPVKLIVE